MKLNKCLNYVNTWQKHFSFINKSNKHFPIVFHNTDLIFLFLSLSLNHGWWTGGELFVGLYTDYWENDGALYRLGNRSFIRTEVGDRQQLNGERKLLKIQALCVADSASCCPQEVVICLVLTSNTSLVNGLHQKTMLVDKLWNWACQPTNHTIWTALSKNRVFR